MLSFGFAHFSREHVHCLSWAEFRALWLYPVTPRSAKQAANMTEPPTRGFAQSLVLIRALTFALLMEQITGRERFSFTYIGGVGTTPTFLTIPREHAKCSNEGGSASDGNLAYFIRNNEGRGTQFDHYVTEASDGLAQEGLARLNLTAIYKLI